MKPAISMLFSVIVGLGIGAAGYWRFGPTLHQRYDWIEIGPKRTEAGKKGEMRSSISYSPEEILGDDDIGLPDIEEIGGRGKFVFLASDSKAHFGFVMNVSVKPTDLKKIPERYRKNRPVKDQPGIQEMALVNATYEVDFAFTLFDKDGFALQELKTQPVDIFAGQNNRIQSQSNEVVDPEIIPKVAAATYEMTVLRNLSVRRGDE